MSSDSRLRLAMALRLSRMAGSGRLSPLNSALTCPIVMSALRPKADAQNARVRIERMSAFPKADIQNVGIGTELNVRLWPKADAR